MSDYQPPDRSPSPAGHQFHNFQVTGGARVHAGDNYHISQVLEDTDAKCLQDLYLTDPRLDKTRIEQTRGGLLRDAFYWILENADFQQWRDDPRSRLLWIKGDPGKGKTMLLCGIIDELKKSNAGTGLTSYFFCQGTDLRINSATAVLRGLIYLLIDQQPSLISHVRKKYEHAGKALFENANAWVSLSEIFASILQDPNLKGAYLIIDALDECVTDLTQLLDLIIQNSSISSQVKWIVSSRNWPKIEERLETVDQQVRLCLELNAASVSTAVSIYIKHKVRKLAQQKKYNNKTESAVQDYLSLNANDTFLWVALVCQNLENVSRWNALAKLNTIPPGLDHLYEIMIQQICSSDDVELCKRILAFVTIVRRPITLNELKSFDEMLEDISEDLESLTEIVGLCGSFLTLREYTIYFVHQSAKDFLLGRAADRIFPSGIEEVNYMIFSRSLEVLFKTLRRDLYGLRTPGFPIDKVKPPDPDPLTAAAYSCVYWVDHLCECEWDYRKRPKHNSDLQEGGKVDKFLRKKYLYWLEALSLLRSMSEGVLSITKLEGLLQGRAEASQFAKLVWDARRFILYNKWIIENSPLQVYASALLFSPGRSLTREMFMREQPEWVITMPIIDGGWSACLQVLEGHSDRVNAVAFSHDSKLLVSASSDKSIRIWDAATGTPQQTLKGHSDSVNSVAFSHDSKLLASASKDKTVRIWDAATGTLQQTLSGHRSWVYAVAFSHDSKLLASASDNKTVRIWNAATGTLQQTLEGHRGSVHSVAFSRDSKLLASASGDRTVWIWDAATGTLQQTLKGHSDSVSAVAFSHDSKLLASASDDKTVRIWDAATGTLRQTLSHSSWVSAVAFSRDSKLLASASIDRIVWIWDVAAGALQQTLKGHGDSVNSVAFSHDSKLLVSASGDGTVRIWDAATSAIQQMLEGHSSSVHSVAFSHDSKLLASVSSDRTVQIWDAATGALQQTLEGHRSWVSAVAFSHDSKLLASASIDGTVRIWDAATGALQQMLENQSRRVNVGAFSRDSKLLVSASGDGTVCIWDAATGALQKMLKGHSDSVSAVAFSHDSKLLASASGDKTVCIWDAATGALQQILEGHSDSVNAAAFSHNLKLLASASSDGTVWIWDVATSALQQILKGHSDSVYAVAFSQDSKLLASASSDGTVLIWDAATGTLQQTIAVDRYISSFLFDITNSILITNIGFIKIDKTEPVSTESVQERGDRSDREGLGISKSWITWNAHNLLWLPPGYRAGCCDISSSRSIIAIGNESGKVFIIGFSLPTLYKSYDS